MKLWIRSQDKKTLQVVEIIYLDEEKGKKIYSGKSIDGYKIGFCLGEYETKQRALEVLDEITHYIDGTVYDMRDRHSVFYDMPKE